MALRASPDILIAGAGIMGLSLALELHHRGAQVILLERDRPALQASRAAAGMLAVDDPHNPPALHPLSQFSNSLYPDFLARLESLSGQPVPFQTETTWQQVDGGHIRRLHEHSLDPRQLSDALLIVAERASIPIHHHAELTHVGSPDPEAGFEAATRNGDRFHAQTLVLATGAWGVPEPLRSARAFVTPSKGQMLRVALPPALRGMNEVHRRAEVYVVPRTQGPQAGSVLIGATVEDAGFDTTTHAADLAALRARAAELVPALADEHTAPMLESWAGLRPATPDALPILSRERDTRLFYALGHGRNGILLAPATATLIADMIEDKATAVDLAPFSHKRFAPS